MDTNAPIDPLAFTQALIRCPSVTPVEAGVLDLLQQTLMRLGFDCHRLPFSDDDTPDVDNLYARIGNGGPNFCFAGHTDVVPVGDAAAWRLAPFDAHVEDGVLYGRGASDMKGAIAAFVGAADRFMQGHGRDFGGSISLLITGDEEGPAINGTVKVLDWLGQRGETIDHCVVGEPTNPERLGQMIKNGRRGSLNGILTVHGAQGHVGYPHLADNPMPRLVATLDRLVQHTFDTGNDYFQPTNLEITSVDVGNETTNVIPSQAVARFNIRFNTEHSGASLSDWLRQQCDAVGGRYDLDIKVSGEPFLTEPGPFTTLLCEAVEAEVGERPELSTTGGTSDARFIRHHCPVVEFGLVGATMHKVDEQTSVSDIEALMGVYENILTRYFK